MPTWFAGHTPDCSELNKLEDIRSGVIVLPHVIFLLFASRGFLLFCPIRWPRSTLFMNPRMKTGLVALPPEALV
jgi:hypothetical protein